MNASTAPRETQTYQSGAVVLEVKGSQQHWLYIDGTFFSFDWLDACDNGHVSFFRFVPGAGDVVLCGVAPDAPCHADIMAVLKQSRLIRG